MSFFSMTHGKSNVYLNTYNGNNNSKNITKGILLQTQRFVYIDGCKTSENVANNEDM